MTLAFEVRIWFLCETHRFIKVNICAKLFDNPSIHGYSQDKQIRTDAHIYIEPPLCQLGGVDRKRARQKR